MTKHCIIITTTMMHFIPEATATAYNVRANNNTVSQKKQDTKLLPITSPFSNFFSPMDSVENLQQTHV